MKKYILTAGILFFIGFLEAQERRSFETDHYITRMEYFRNHPLEQNQIIFLGNSLTQGGRWHEYFPNQRTANRGIVGDNTEGILARLDEVINAKPQKLFVMCGTNDISQNLSNDCIIGNMREIIRRVREGSPKTEIFWQSNLPINNDFGRFPRLFGKEEQLLDLVSRIRAMTEEENITFIYLFPLFTDEEGKLDASLTTDGIHINQAGYQIWVNAIREFVER